MKVKALEQYLKLISSLFVYINMRFFFCLSYFFYFSCAKAPDIPFSKEGLTLYQEMTGASIKQFVSEKNLAGIISREFYEVKARFSKESYLELLSHSRVPHLGDGIRIKIDREKDKLIIRAGTQGYPLKILLERENYFINQFEIDWTLEIENGTLYGFRVQIWENFLNKSGFIKQKTELLTKENQITDSLEQALTFYTKGQGLQWGVKTFKSELISVFRIPNQKP